MARNKQLNPWCQGDPPPPAKAPKRLLRESGPPVNQRAFRFHPGTRAKI